MFKALLLSLNSAECFLFTRPSQTDGVMEGGKKKVMFICYVNAEVQVNVQLTRSTRALPR